VCCCEEEYLFPGDTEGGMSSADSALIGVESE